MNEQAQDHPTRAATLEFTVEPFVPDKPGPHVTASIEAARATANGVEIGPFGTTVHGSAADMATITQAVVDAALSNGASRVSLQVSIADDTTQEPGAR